MIEEIKFLHRKITRDEIIRVVLLRNNWEVTIDRTDIIGEYHNCLRIVRKDGRITSINPDAIAMVCTMRRTSL